LEATEPALVYSVAFSPDGRYIRSEIGAIPSPLGQGRRQGGAVFEATPAFVTSLAFSPDGKFIASGSYDTTIRLWDRDAGKEVRVFEGHTN